MSDEQNQADPRKLAASFEDPNAQEDTRLGKSFAATNASGKPRHPVHLETPKERKWLWVGLIVAAVVFVLALLAGAVPRLLRKHELDKEAAQTKKAKPVVIAEKVIPAKIGAGVTIPGTMIPLTEAYVYARASGYLKTRYADIGDHVRKGQLLAIIEAPDLDAQVAQARQQLQQAEQQLANQQSQLDLQRVTQERYRVLVAKGVLSRQQGDQQETNFATQQANVAAAERNVAAFKANLDREIALQQYEYVRAPFAGVVTQRNVDVGALISSAGVSGGGGTGPSPTGQFSTSGGTQQASQSNNGGSSGSPSTAATSSQSPGQGGPLFGIADETRLRILVSVPENYAVSVRPGGHAKLSVQEYASSVFTGEITRTANSIDANTRTLLTEVQVDNHDGKLIPGMYTTVVFPSAPGEKGALQVPGDAVVVRRNTTTVAVVRNGKVHFQPVLLGRDFGDVVEVVSGLKEGDIVVTSVTDQVSEGREVQLKMQTPNAQPEGSEGHAPSGGGRS